MKMIMAVSLVAIFTTTPVMASTPECGKRDEIVLRLATEKNEYQDSRAVLKNGNLLEIFISESGTFTMIMTINNDACIIGTGEGWELVNIDEIDKGDLKKPVSFKR